MVLDAHGPHDRAGDPVLDTPPGDEFFVPELPANYIIEDSLIEDNRLGQLLLRHRMVSAEQLDTALGEQLGTPGRLLGEVLIEQALVTAEDLENVLKLQLAELQLGQILVRTKTISRDQLDIALLEQESTGELLGSVLIGFGFCTPEQINWALDMQTRE